MTFFNSVLNLSVFLLGFALLVLSLYLKYNDTFSCILGYSDGDSDLQAKRDTAKICLDIIVFMSIGMLLLPLGCFMCAGKDTFTSQSRADDEWAFGKLGTLPLAIAGLMGLTVVVCGSILYSYKKVSGFKCPDVDEGMMGPNTALQWLLGFGSAMALFGLGGAYVHHNQLVKTGHKGKKIKLDKEGKPVKNDAGDFEMMDLDTGAPLPKLSFGQRRSRFSNRSRSR